MSGRIVIEKHDDRKAPWCGKRIHAVMTWFCGQRPIDCRAPWQFDGIIGSIRWNLAPARILWKMMGPRKNDHEDSYSLRLYLWGSLPGTFLLNGCCLRKRPWLNRRPCWSQYLRSQPLESLSRIQWDHYLRSQSAGSTEAMTKGRKSLERPWRSWSTGLNHFLNLKNSESLCSERRAAETPLSSCSATCPSVLGRLVMLFYRYMLPHVTTEAYSWANPAEAFFGFKTGVKNGLSWPRSPFPISGNEYSYGLLVTSNNKNIFEW